MRQTVDAALDEPLANGDTESASGRVAKKNVLIDVGFEHILDELQNPENGRDRVFHIAWEFGLRRQSVVDRKDRDIEVFGDFPEVHCRLPVGSPNRSLRRAYTGGRRRWMR